MPYDRGVPRSIGESPLDEFSQPAMGQVVADEQDRPVEREVIVARQVAARDTRRATASGRLRFLHFDGAIGRVKQAAGAVEDHAARVDHVDPRVDQDGDVRGRRESGDREDAGRAEGFLHPPDGGDELAGRPLELGTVGEEHDLRVCGARQVGLRGDDREVSCRPLLGEFEVGHR